MSATMPLEVLDIKMLLMRNPFRIMVKEEELTLEGIKQFFVNVDREEWKLDTLADLYETLTITQAIIYVNTKEKADWLSEKLYEREFTVSSMHGDMPTEDREKVLKEFRLGESRILIATGDLAGGIHVQQVSLVINYDLPSTAESYIKRVGRSSRFGRKGVVINFITEEDVRMLNDIRQFYKTSINELPLNVADLL